MSEWKYVELGQIANIRGGKRLPRGEMLTKIPTHHPYIRVTDLKNSRIDLDGIMYVEPEIQKAIKRYTVEYDDLILSIVGTIGLVAIVPKELHGSNLTENCVKIHQNKNLLGTRYLYHYLRSSIGQDEINSLVVGSTQPKFPLYNIRKIKLLLPPLPEQEAIAEVLSSLDDKIDLLHRNNKTLEELAETLFRQWFVEKAGEDWPEENLSAQLDFYYGKSLREDKRTGTGYPVYGSGGMTGFHSEYLVKGPGVIVGRKGTIGTVTYVFDNFFPIDTTYYIKPKKETVNQLYEYHLLKTLGLADMNSDSAVPGLNREMAMSLKVLKPPKVLIDKYEEFCDPFFERIKKNRMQIQHLETLRNLLLPKLMAGVLRVLM